MVSLSTDLVSDISGEGAGFPLHLCEINNSFSWQSERHGGSGSEPWCSRDLISSIKWLRLKWNPIHYLVHYFRPKTYGPLSKVVHYIWNRVRFGTQCLKRIWRSVTVTRENEEYYSWCWLMMKHIMIPFYCTVRKTYSSFCSYEQTTFGYIFQGRPAWQREPLQLYA